VDDQGRARYNLHCTKHWFASWAISRGFNAKEAQTMLGHTSVVMTLDVYGHLMPTAERPHDRLETGLPPGLLG
ncbi:hypothetical protein R0J92_25810, partial [Tritonibacter sp. SIMBA_163]